ncbi:MAG: hypothetical protein P4M04_14740 [Acidobacteriota bacterium]|nr:hypothetical protein [Acidobacteriota bacterium]
MVIKIFFALLVLGTVAVVAVCLAIHLRVKRHLRQEEMDAQVRSVLDEAAQSTTEEKMP